MDLDLDLYDSLMKACKNGDLERLKKLFTENNNNVDINKYYPNFIIDECHCTLLIYVCYRGNINIVKFLLENRADPDLKCNCEQKYTSLHFACSNGNLEIVDVLVNAGANLFEKNGRNETPLNYAGKNIIKKYKDYNSHKLIKAANKK